MLSDIWGGRVTFEWVMTALVGIVVDRGVRGIESGSSEESSDEDSASGGRAERGGTGGSGLGCG